MSKKSAKEKKGACCAGLAEVIPPRLFKALCDPTRIAILARLAECGAECTVGEAARCVPIDLSVVSRHLAILRDAGILESERRGKEVYYRVSAAPLVRSLRAMADAIASCCPPNEHGTRRKS